jgi:nicotinamidase-related amidase
MKSALLIVDVQNGVFNAPRRPHEADAVVERIAELIAAERHRESLIVAIQHETRGLVEPGTWEWQVVGNLRIRSGDTFVSKSTPDAFLGTDLERVLLAHGVETVMICGYASDMCIDRTAYRAAGLGFQVVVVGDAHTTRDKTYLDAKRIREHHNFILSLHPAVRVVDHAELLARI